MSSARLSPEDFRGTDRFRVERRLGAGGSGVVYQAFDRERNAVVALKALRRADAEALYRFKGEFRALADLAHPNLISLYELLCEGDQWFFTMELVDGANFLEYVRGLEDASPQDLDLTTPTVTVESATDHARPDPGVLSPISASPRQLARLRSALRQLAEGLCALHEAGKLHRDIKPSNVLVSRDDRVVLLDFGLVSELGSREGGAAEVAGTPAYMSPEQAHGLPLSEASDWCSVGVMVYAALTGRLPFPRRPDDLTPPEEWKPVPARAFVPALPGDIDGLCTSLLLREPRSRPSGRQVLHLLGREGVSSAQAAPTPREAPFVGRESYLSEIDDAFRATQDGRAVTVYLSGASGVGKTALVHRFLDRLRRERQAVVLSGRCYERESVPYKAMDALVDALSRYLKALTPGEAEALMPRDLPALARVFPVLRRVEAVARSRRRSLDIPDLQELRRRAFGALRELLARLGDRESLVLFLDDVQWGDADSAALVAELTRPPDPPNLLLIICYRSEDAEESLFLRALLAGETLPGPAPEARALVVETLTPAESRELAIRLIGDAADAGARVEAVVHESGGNPLLLHELARHALQAAPSKSGERGRITLETALQDRLAGLPPAARRLLELVAVAGQPLRVEAATRAANVEVEGPDVLRALRAAHLVRTRGARERAEVETYHDRIRDAVLASLSAEELREYHERLALALEAAGEAGPETLAAHFEAGGDRERAAECAAAAAVQAFDALAFQRAAQLYRWTLELRAWPEAEARGLRVRLGDALANAGRGAEAAQAYLAAVAGAPAADQLELRRRSAEQLLVSGHIDEGLAELRAVLATIGLKLAETPRGALVSLALLRARLRLRGLRFRERDPTQVSTERLIRIDTCWSVAVGLAIADPMRAADFAARHLLLALQAGEPYRVARGLALEVGFSAVSGGRSRARTERLVRRAADLAERIGHPHALALVKLTAGVSAYLQGDWEKARVLIEQAEQMLRERCTGVAWELDQALIYWTLTMFTLGRLRELLERVPAFLREAQDRGDLWVASGLRARAAHVIFLAADQPEEARRELQEAMGQWSRQGFHVQHLWELFAQVEIALYAGRGPEAWKLMNEGWPQLRRSFLLLRIQHSRVWALYMRARSALAAAGSEGETGSLLETAEQDARRIEAEGVAWATPLALLIRAGLEGARGHPEAALAQLAAAEAGLETSQMALYAACARRHRGELLGGDEGRALVEAADAWMASQSVKNPARMADMLAPWGRR